MAARTSTLDVLEIPIRAGHPTSSVPARLADERSVCAVTDRHLGSLADLDRVPQAGRAPAGFLAAPSRVALAGDWHANAAYAVEAIRHARRRDSDVVIQLGDFGFHFLDAFLDALDAALADEDLSLGFVDGNHENFDRLLAIPRRLGYRVEYRHAARPPALAGS